MPLIASSLHRQRSLEEQACVIWALSHPVRLILLRTLLQAQSGHPLSVADLHTLVCAQYQQLTKPTVSYHLGLLEEKGMLTQRREGTTIYYDVVPSLVRLFHQLLSWLSNS